MVFRGPCLVGHVGENCSPPRGGKALSPKQSSAVTLSPHSGVPLSCWATTPPKTGVYAEQVHVVRRHMAWMEGRRSQGQPPPPVDKQFFWKISLDHRDEAHRNGIHCSRAPVLLPATYQSLLVVRLGLDERDGPVPLTWGSRGN